MIKRQMSVVRAPSTNGKPMLRIVNNLLTKAGFEIGTPIEVTYRRGRISIKKLEKQNHEHLQKPSSVTVPSNSKEVVRRAEERE